MVAMVSFYLFTSLSRGPRSLLPPTATSFPVDAFKSKLAEAGTAWTEARVVVDRSVVTSQGPGTSLQFALKLVERLVSREKAEEIAKALLTQMP